MIIHFNIYNIKIGIFEVNLNLMHQNKMKNSEVSMAFHGCKCYNIYIVSLKFIDYGILHRNVTQSDY